MVRGNRKGVGTLEVDHSQDTIAIKFKLLWPYYIIQSLLATAAIFALIFIFDKERILLISAMGSTAFIVFALPKTVAAKRRNVICGHMIAVFIGFLFSMLNLLFDLPYFATYPFAVGIAIFLMVALDFEHPPAAGTAMAVVINPITGQVFLSIMLSAIVLAYLRYYLRDFLRDLI